MRKVESIQGNVKQNYPTTLDALSCNHKWVTTILFLING